jgi:hypothetical protein
LEEQIQTLKALIHSNKRNLELEKAISRLECHTNSETIVEQHLLKLHSQTTKWWFHPPKKTSKQQRMLTGTSVTKQFPMSRPMQVNTKQIQGWHHPRNKTKSVE